MGKGLPRSHSRGSFADRPVVKQTILMSALAFTVDGAATLGEGQVVMGDLPEGNILVLGAVAYVSVAGPGGDAGLVDTWNGDFSIGTTADADEDITSPGSDNDIIASQAMGPAVAEVGPRTRGEMGTTGIILDNTDGSLELNLNVLVDDADISADGIAFTATGELYISFVVLGDD